jgi:hypothetical protein
MIKEKKVSKYLLYAIGEIILVVIGILIALQINTWNEERKISQQERTYLERLRIETISNIETFSLSIEDIERGNTSITDMSEAMKLNSTPDSALIHSVREYLAFGSIYPVFSYSRSTFDDLSSTGNLAVIKNTRLRDEIVQHYANYEQADKWIRVAMDWALPLDAPYTVENDVMEFEPHTSFLYPERSMEEKANELRERRMSHISNSAAHLWINRDAIHQMKGLIEDSNSLLENLTRELNIEKE